MRFRNSLRLLTVNFKNVYKILLYHLIVILLSSALVAAIVYPQIEEILSSAQMKQVIDDVKGFFRAVGTGNSEYLEGFKENFTGANGSLTELVQYLKTMTSHIVWAIVGCAGIYLLERFLNTVCYYAAASTLNDRMETYADTPFFDSYVKNFGRACIYSVVYVPIVFLADLLIFGVCYFLFFYLFGFLNLFFSAFLSVVFIMMAQSLKLTLTASWLPSMVAGGDSIGKAMRLKGKTTRKQRQRIFFTYLTTLYFVLTVNVAAALSSLGTALLITLPASYFFFICEQFVNYYTLSGKKYFLTYESVVVNPTNGQRDGFFVGMEKAKEELASGEDKTQK